MVLPSIDRNSSLPLYAQLKDALLQVIADGTLAVGDKLPTERELQETHQVSRATVRNALHLLEQQGYIRRLQGVGTVVTKPKIKPEMVKLTSFTEDLQARGMKPGSQTLDVSLISPPNEAIEPLQLTTNDKVWYVQRLRMADDEPVGIHNLFIPPTLEFSPHELQTMTSYYSLLRKHHGIEPERAIERFTAKNASSKEAELLRIAKGTALLVIQRVTHTINEQPIEFVNLVYRADRYEYNVQLHR